MNTPINLPSQTPSGSDQITAAQTVTSVSSEPGKAQAVANNATPKESVSMDSTAGTMGQLQTMAPEVVQAMLKGIAAQILRESQAHQDRINALIRENMYK